MTTLHNAQTLSIEGPDAAVFANGQFSSDVLSLEVGHWQFSAWLDPRGRVRTLFHLARLAPDSYLLLLRGGSAQMMADELRRFVFRSKLSLSVLPTGGLACGPAGVMHDVSSDENLISLGCDTHSLRIVAADHGDDAWRAPQLESGWPWLPESLLGELLPAALSLQRLNAVAVDKGCYPGQEIVARLHFRGGHKRHLHRVRLSHPMNAGDRLHRDGREVGCVVDMLATNDAIEALVIVSDETITQGNQAHRPTFDNSLAADILASWPA